MQAADVMTSYDMHRRIKRSSGCTTPSSTIGTRFIFTDDEESSWSSRRTCRTSLLGAFATSIMASAFFTWCSI